MKVKGTLYLCLSGSYLDMVVGRHLRVGGGLGDEGAVGQVLEQGSFMQFEGLPSGMVLLLHARGVEDLLDLKDAVVEFGEASRSKVPQIGVDPVVDAVDGAFHGGLVAWGGHPGGHQGGFVVATPLHHQFGQRGLVAVGLGDALLHVSVFADWVTSSMKCIMRFMAPIRGSKDWSLNIREAEVVRGISAARA